MVAAKAMALPVAHSAPLDRSRVRNFGVGLASTGDLMSCAPAPTVLLWRCATGPISQENRPSASDQGANQGPNWPLGQLVEIILTFSPLISPYDLNSTFFIFSHSITDQCIERASSSRSVTIRFNNYNAPLCFETDTQLGP